jgi:hypothetical protein
LGRCGYVAGVRRIGEYVDSGKKNKIKFRKFG